MKEQVKELRVKIDGLAELAKNLTPYSNQLNKCIDSLLLGKAWLGKVLGELGVETPYKNDGKRKEVKDIESTADTIPKTIAEMKPIDWFSNGFDVFINTQWKEKNHIEKVDWLRERIQSVINYVINLNFEQSQGRQIAIARTNSYNHLCEARYWLGFELEHIRESNKETINQ